MLAFRMFVALSVLMVTEGLQCHKCSYNEIATSSPLLNKFVNYFKRMNNEDCKKSDLETPEDMLETCPDPPAGKQARCMVMNGTVTANLLGALGVNFRTVTRACAEVDPSTNMMIDGCYDDPPANDLARLILTAFFKILSIGSIEFDGTSCYYGVATFGDTLKLREMPPATPPVPASAHQSTSWPCIVYMSGLLVAFIL